MARQQRMVEIIDLTREDSDEVQEVVDVGRSMIRGRSETKPCHGSDANKANTLFSTLDDWSDAPPPLPQLPVPSSQYSSSFRVIPLQDRPDTINPLDGSKAKKIRKWEHDPYVIFQSNFLVWSCVSRGKHDAHINFKIEFGRHYVSISISVFKRLLIALSLETQVHVMFSLPQPPIQTGLA
jgi:hypothetical protein